VSYLALGLALRAFDPREVLRLLRRRQAVAAVGTVGAA